MKNVEPFPLTNEQARKVISQLAQNSSNITWVNNCTDGPWEKKVNYRQALLCLQEGEVKGEPVFNKKTKCWECRMYRFYAGQDILINVVLTHGKDELYVVNICEEN